VDILARGCTEQKQTTTSLDQMAGWSSLIVHFTYRELGDSCNGLANDSQKVILAAGADVSWENCSSYFFPTFSASL
jgi:hypothetical protein